MSLGVPDPDLDENEPFDLHDFAARFKALILIGTFTDDPLNEVSEEDIADAAQAYFAQKGRNPTISEDSDFMEFLEAHLQSGKN